MSYISLFILFIIGLLGTLSKSVKADERRGNITASYGFQTLTKVGKIIIALLCASFLIALLTMYESSKEAKDIEKVLNNLRLERDLSGFEVSFKPSAEHWSKIAQVLDKIEPPAPGFPYSASTITAESMQLYWKVDFTAIESPAGSVRPGPVYTNQPDGKIFEEVIDNAVIDLLIILGRDLKTEVSPRGDYPSSVTVSRDLIVYTFRPPLIKLNLASLNDNPTIMFRGHNQYPPSVRIRSLDNIVKFDKTIDLSWKESESAGTTHMEKMMPYTAGPYSLDLFIRNPVK